MNVVPFPKASSEAVPIVAFLDLQGEYVAEGRALYIESAAQAIKNCSTLLTEARALRLPIAHFRISLPGQFFNPSSRFSSWIETTQPRASEYVYERQFPSCYTCTDFCDLMDEVDEPHVILAGLSGESACLSSIIEGFHRGYDTTYVADCSASAPLKNFDEDRSHRAVCDIASNYADIVSLEEALASMKRLAGRRARAADL